MPTEEQLFEPDRWVSVAASRIQAILETPVPDYSRMGRDVKHGKVAAPTEWETALTFMAVYECDGHGCCAVIARGRSHPWTVRLSAFATQAQLQDRGSLTAFEIALFLGMDAVDPSSYSWIQQSALSQSGLLIVRDAVEVPTFTPGR